MECEFKKGLGKDACVKSSLGQGNADSLYIGCILSCLYILNMTSSGSIYDDIAHNGVK